MKSRDEKLLAEAYQKIVEAPLPRTGPGSIGYVERDVFMIDLYDGRAVKSDKLPEEITEPGAPGEGFEEVPGQGEKIVVLKKQGKGYIFVITPKPEKTNKLCVKIQLPSLITSVVDPYEANKMVQGIQSKQGDKNSVHNYYTTYKGKDFIMLVSNVVGLPAFDDQLRQGARGQAPVAQQQVRR